MNNPSENNGIDPRLAEKLLALPTLAQQLTFLQDANLAHTEGLLRLLDYAAELVRDNPGQARRLAAICADVAGQAGIGEAIPRAAYIKAQTYALAGEFGLALDLIMEARDGYLALGQELPALRTTAGLMHVLGDSGRYQEALDAGQRVLDEIGRAEQPALASLAAVIQQNMGMCYSYMGRYDAALEAYNAAEAHCLTWGMTIQASDMINNRGVLLWDMGRGTEALEALEKSLAIRVEAGLTMSQAQSLSNIGGAHLLLGNYTASLQAFEKARRLFDSLDALVDQHILLLDTAKAYLTLNLYPEALAAYQEANRLLQAAGVIHERARALWGLGATLLAQGRLDEAENVLAEAVAILEAMSEAPTPLLANILLEQAAVQSARNKQAIALSTAEHALDMVTGHDWPVLAIYAHLQLADLAREDLSQAEAHLMAAQHLADPFGLPHLRYRLQQRLGRLRRLQGRNDEGRVLLEAAIGEVEHLRGTLAQETMRTSFLHDKVAAYDELMQLYLAWGDEQGVQRAFGVAEQAKSRTLLDLISGVIEPKPTPFADETEAAQLQKLQADLNAIYNELLGNGGMDGYEGRYNTIHTRAAELEGAINQLRLRMAASGATPDVWAAPLPLQAVQAQLPAQVTLLSYHIVEDEILAFVIGRNSMRVWRHLGQASNVQLLVRRLGGMLDRLRAGQAFTRDHIARLELSARRVLAALYQALVAPLETCLAETAMAGGSAEPRAACTCGASTGEPGRRLAEVGSDPPRKLTVIPHGCLHQVPFHALFDDQGYLIDRFEISYAPSVTIYLHCQQRPASAVPRTGYAASAIHQALVLGVSDPSIPAVAAEVQAVADHLPLARVYMDEQATLATLQAEAPGCQLLHLACHGLFRADNPIFSALKLHDGWLTASDAMQLNLSNALVTLSACESGRGQVAGGEVIGLLRAFLGAGAATVVVSLWLAQDDATARLMSDWYAYLHNQGVGPATALRAAQLALKADYPHPYYWAPFIAVGRR
jgi:tetratricopeptide (TPR) repeat protein